MNNFNSKDSKIKYLFDFDKNINEKFDLIFLCSIGTYRWNETFSNSEKFS